MVTLSDAKSLVNGINPSPPLRMTFVSYNAKSGKDNSAKLYLYEPFFL
jgi:hypothetical protein